MQGRVLVKAVVLVEAVVLAGAAATGEALAGAELTLPLKDGMDQPTIPLMGVPTP